MNLVKNIAERFNGFLMMVGNIIKDAPAGIRSFLLILEGLAILIALVYAAKHMLHQAISYLSRIDWETRRAAVKNYVFFTIKTTAAKILYMTISVCSKTHLMLNHHHERSRMGREHWIGMLEHSLDLTGIEMGNVQRAEGSEK